MLTRLRIEGFKNLKDVDLRLGLFACVAGPNGVGKSNLFDAITFLGDLASMPVTKAAQKARGTNGRASDFDSLFYRDRHGAGDRIKFVAEMIVPSLVSDDFDRQARPTATFLEYTLVLRRNVDPAQSRSKEPMYIERETLKAKPSSDAVKVLDSTLSRDLVKKFVFGPGNRRLPFIDTRGDAEKPVIVLYGEKGKGGRPPEVPAFRSPQSVLSGVNASTHPTALAAKREMQSWRLMQLEPSALRKPDEYNDDSVVSAVGQHLPNALARLQNNAEVANRLSELLPDVRSLEVDEDDKRELRTVIITMRDGQRYSASSLSDGTLRFLALSLLASDPESAGLVCMEEPENGIHPLKIPEMLRLVRRLSDAELEDESMDVGARTALRQVLINTHSPLVVQELPDDELLMAQTFKLRGATFISFKPLEGTWRSSSDGSAPTPNGFIARGELIRYLTGWRADNTRISKKPRVSDHYGISDQLDIFHSKMEQ